MRTGRSDVSGCLLPALARSRQAAAGRVGLGLGLCVGLGRAACVSARSVGAARLAAPAAAVGASHRLPSLLASGSCGRTRFARCARSAQTGGRKSDFTKRAARADPEAARLGAAEVAARRAAPTLRALTHAARPSPTHSPSPSPTRPAAACRSSNAGGSPPRHPNADDRFTHERHRTRREPPTHLAKAQAVCRGRACAQPRSAAAPARARSARRGLTPVSPSTRAPAADGPRLCAHQRIARIAAER